MAAVPPTPSFMSATFLCESLPEHGLSSGGGRDANGQRLLLVDDDAPMVRTLEYYFERRGFEVVGVATVAAAKVSFSTRAPWTLVISDYHLPDGNGWELCCWVREQAKATPPFLLISGSATAEVYAAKVDFLAKPFSMQQLEMRVVSLLATDRAGSAGHVALDHRGRPRPRR